MKCPNCNEELQEGVNVCTNCGTQLSEEASEPAKAVEPIEPAEVVEDVTEIVETTMTEAAENTAQTVEVPTAEALKKKNSKKLVVGGVVAVAVIAVAVSAAAMLGRKDPKTAIIDACKSVYSSDVEYPMEEIFGFKELGKTIQKENTEIGFGLSIADSDDPTIQPLAGSGLTIHSQNDIANKTGNTTMGIQFGGMDILSMNMYVDDTKLLVGFPGLSTKVFSLDYVNDLQGQIDRSPYLGTVMTESDMDPDAIADYIDYLQTVAAKDGQIMDLEGLWKRYKEASKATGDLKTAMIAEKQEKQTFTVDGKQELCQGYTAILPKAALIQFVKTTAQFFVDDETFKKEYLDYMNQVMAFYQATYGESATGWDNTQEGVDNLVKAMENIGDINLLVYTDKAGRMAAMTASTIVTLQDQPELNISLHAELKGGSYLTQNADVVLTMASGEDTVDFVMNKTGTYDKKDLISDIKFTTSTSADTLAYNGSYHVESGDYSIGIILGDSTGIIGTLTASGIVTNLVKGKSLDIAMDSIAFESDGELGMDLSGTYYVKPLEGEVTAPQGEEMDMLAATEEQWATALEEILQAFLSLIMGPQ